MNEATRNIKANYVAGYNVARRDQDHGEVGRVMDTELPSRCQAPSAGEPSGGLQLQNLLTLLSVQSLQSAFLVLPPH